MKTIVLILLAVFIVGCKNSSVKVYLMPEGYEGALVLIEDETSDVAVNRKGDTTIFDFRKSNILRLKGEFIEGVTDLANLQYYYVDLEGNRTLVNHLLGNNVKDDSTKAYVYLQYSQIGQNSQCDLISTPKNFKHNLHLQMKLCDSLLSKRPSQ